LGFLINPGSGTGLAGVATQVQVTVVDGTVPAAVAGGDATVELLSQQASLDVTLASLLGESSSGEIIHSKGSFTSMSLPLGCHVSQKNSGKNLGWGVN